MKEAYVRGLLSEDTFLLRMTRVLTCSSVLEADQLVGDVDLRGELGGLGSRVSEWMRTSTGRLDEMFTHEPSRLLALDWAATESELILGRSRSCDLHLDEPTVSRRHDQLWLHHERWLPQDLSSTNRTFVNGRRVARCFELRPGDLLTLGELKLRVDERRSSGRSSRHRSTHTPRPGQLTDP